MEDSVTLPHEYVRAQITFAARSQIPADTTMINLYYSPPGSEIPVDGGSGTALIDALAQAVEDYLGAPPPPHINTIATLLGPGISRAVGDTKMSLYRIPVSKALSGPPFAVRSLTLPGNPPTTGMPGEVAIVQTYHGDLSGIPEKGPNNTRPAANRRGRFYLGPLAGNVMTIDSSTGRVKVLLDVLGLMNDAAGNYLKLSAQASSWTWSVFSRTLWQAFEVRGVAVDDAFDTQRRRGEDAAIRQKVAL